jgi:hypothetical protein
MGRVGGQEPGGASSATRLASGATGADLALTGALDLATVELDAGVLTPTALSGSTDNWGPTGLSAATVVRASAGGANKNLTGIVAPSPAAARLLLLQNVGAGSIVLKHDVTSTAANRFLCPNSADYSLTPNSSAFLLYDTASARWRVLEVA